MESGVDESKVFGIDIDGVIADFGGAFIRYLSAETGVPMEASQITSWEFWRQFDMSAEEFYRVFRQFGDSGGLSRLAPIPGAITTLRHLHLYHPVYFITHRRPEERGSTEEWFAKYMPFVDFGTIYFTRYKSKVANDLGVTHFIDDKPENVAEMKYEGEVPNCILFARSHNTHAHFEDIPRAETWDDVIQLWDLFPDFMAPV